MGFRRDIDKDLVDDLMMTELHKFLESSETLLKPKVYIEQSLGHYSYKTITTKTELLAAFKLRYEIFYQELMGETLPEDQLQLDIDEFDSICDHLIIIENKSQKIVGTYRLNSSTFSNHFYSAGEFNLTQLLALPGHKLELGRACIHSSYRKGAVILMLWRGIAEYMRATGTQTLFGCASIKTESVHEAALIYSYFLQNNLMELDYHIHPLPKFSFKHFTEALEHYNDRLSEENTLRAQSLIPSLCQAYLNIGCKMGGVPAYDKDFKCIDFLTVLETTKLDQTIWKKMGG